MLDATMLVAFQDELEKLANEGDKKVRLSGWERGAGFGALGAGLLGIPAHRLSSLPSGPKSKGIADKVLQLARAGGVRAARNPVADLTDHYNPAAHSIEIGLRSGADAAAHELGHARGGLLKRLFASSAVGRGSRALLSLGGAALVGKLVDEASHSHGGAVVTKKERDAAEKVLKYMGLGGSAVFAPVLLEEARASLQVPGILKEVGASIPRRYWELAKLLPAYGTYATAGLAPLVPWFLFRHGKKVRERKRAETHRVRAHTRKGRTVRAHDRASRRRA